MGRFVTFTQSTGQLGRLVECEPGQREIVIGHRRKPRLPAVIVDLGRGTERQPTAALRILHRQLLEESRRPGDPRIGALLEVSTVATITPVQVKMVSEPRRNGRRHRILAPSAHRFAVERRHPRHIQSSTPEKSFRITSESVAMTPQPVRETDLLVQVVGPVCRPIAQLRIQVVVKIPFPGRQLPVVGRPNSLQRNRRHIGACCRAEFVLLQIPLLFQHAVGQRNGRFVPEPLPPGAVHLIGVRIPFAERFTHI